MGINLALDILDRGADGGPHGGPAEAVDELVRESFWMTDAELRRAERWAATHSPILQIVINSERSKRRSNAPVEHRTN